MQRKRRGRGEGAIFQRADGQWVATVSLGYKHDGKRRRRTVYGATKEEVAKKLRKLQTKADAGRLRDADRLTLSDYLAAWLENKIGAPTAGFALTRSWRTVSCRPFP
jgi:integrase